MKELLFGRDALWFTVPAFVGTFFFLVRMLIMAVGSGLDLHHDAGDSFDLEQHDSGGAFKVLSVQAIAAFLMGFGWVGLGVVAGSGMSPWLGAPAGLVGGVGMMWLLARLLRTVSRLQSSGSLDISAALAEEGTVYVTVPARRQGKGSVRVVIGDRQQYYQAVTDGDAIATSTRVRVTEVNDDNSLTVERSPDSLPSGV